MKRIHVCCVVALVAGRVAIAQTPDNNDEPIEIQGAFGYHLGASLDEVRKNSTLEPKLFSNMWRYRDTGSRMDDKTPTITIAPDALVTSDFRATGYGKLYTVTPLRALPPFKEYFVAVTPVSNRVYMIFAASGALAPDISANYMKGLSVALEEKYMRKLTTELMQKSASIILPIRGSTKGTRIISLYANSRISGRDHGGIFKPNYEIRIAYADSALAMVAYTENRDYQNAEDRQKRATAEKESREKMIPIDARGL